MPLEIEAPSLRTRWRKLIANHLTHLNDDIESASPFGALFYLHRQHASSGSCSGRSCAALAVGAHVLARPCFGESFPPARRTGPLRDQAPNLIIHGVVFVVVRGPQSFLDGDVLFSLFYF